MKKQSIIKYIFLLLLMGGLIVIDQLTKHLADLYLKNKDPFVIIKNVFELNYLDGGNTGAAWGMLSGQLEILIIMPSIICILLVIFIYRIQKLIEFAYVNKINFKRINKIYTYLQIFIVILISGAVGNLIDRIMNKYVVDFFYFKLIDFPIFNVADCYVTVSMAFIFIFLVFIVKDEEVSYILTTKSEDLVKKNKIEIDKNEVTNE